jgi:hypothetical protein
MPLLGVDVTDQSPFATHANPVRTVRISEGLFLLRYVSSKAGLNAPTVSVMAPVDPGIDVIAPADEGPRLVAPGDGLVVRATRGALLNLSVTPIQRNGSCDAELVLERVSTSIRQEMPLPASDELARRVAASGTNQIEVLAHVARRGDIVVRSGEWICGPQLPMAIEGLEIRWANRRQDLDIISRATVNARGLRTLAEQPIGCFLGTRGRAAPITALTLNLVGSAAVDFLLNCDALFFGQHVISTSGRACILSGPTGREALVGLRLSVVAAVEQKAQQPLMHLDTQSAEDIRVATPRLTSIPSERSSRVRIFRTSHGRPASAAMLSK